jgi:hypothetical protein
VRATKTTTKNYIPKQKLIRLMFVFSNNKFIDDGFVGKVEPGTNDSPDVAGM